MFTQCSQCETVFKLSAEVLRAAGGQVRCGKCGEVFNALAHLAEDASAFATGESAFDLETRADSILQSVPSAPLPRHPEDGGDDFAPPGVAHRDDFGDQHPDEGVEDFAPPGVEIARLQILDWNEGELPGAHRQRRADDAARQRGADDTERQRRADEAARQRVADEAARQRRADDAARQRAADDTERQRRADDAARQRVADEAARRRVADDAERQRVADDAERRLAEREAEAAGEAAQFEASLEFTLPPGELDRVFVESAAPRPPPPPTRPVAAQKVAERQPQRRPQPEPEPAPPSEPEPEEVEVFDASDHIAEPIGLQVSEAARREMLSGLQPDAPPSLKPARQGTSSRRSSVPWFGAVIAAALLLVAQVTHQNREWLAAHAPLGGALRALYAALGAPIPKPANLSAYQLRQWGVTGDPAADGTLRVRASILNASPQPEPFPLLRVTLANRFGGSVGTRDFEPTEYVGRPISGSMVPGERVDATMNILDPGKSAEGFEIDVCLRGANGTVACANDAHAAAKK